MTLRRALYQSRNIPAIKLGMEVGLENVIDEARRFGVTTDVAPVPSISIGSADVVPLEIISAYTAFANDGQRAEPQAILRVEDRDGNILWQPTVRRIQVLEPSVAWLMTDVLRDVVRRGTAAGHRRRADQLHRGGQDRHDQRRLRRLVRRLHARARHRRVDRVRPAEEDHEQRAGWPARGPGVDGDDEGGLRPALHHLRVDPAGGPAGRRDRQHHRLPGDAVLPAAAALRGEFRAGHRADDVLPGAFADARRARA